MSTRQARPTPQQIVDEASRQHRAGNLPYAAALYKEALKHAPDHPDLLAALAGAEAGMNQFVSARANLRKAVKARPMRAELHARLAQAELTVGDTDAALAEADESLRLDPGLALGVQTKAQILRVMGRRAEALDLLRPFLDAGTADVGMRIAYAEVAASIEGDERAVAILDPIAADESHAPYIRAAAWYRLATSLDRMGDHARAFECARNANEASPSHWDAGAITQQFDEMIAATGPDAVAGFRRAKFVSDQPVFILGMPRSGTSLVEQILASHPKVHAAGERREMSLIAQRLLGGGGEQTPMGERLAAVRQGDVDREARNYVRAMKGLAGEGATRVTDKMPHNFLHLAVIDTVFPGAHVIHCVRDARDTCLSCYMQEFQGAMHAYTRNLRDLGLFYNDYARLMAHWKRVLKVPIMDVRYEELVRDPGRVVPQIVDFVGLEWDDACLRHHETQRAVVTLSAEQARKPIYESSLARWKAYEAELAALVEALDPPGEPPLA